MMNTKSSSRGGVSSSKNNEESDPKPLSTTLLQEFQNLKDKFKNEDDNQDRGLFNDFKFYCF